MAPLQGTAAKTHNDAMISTSKSTAGAISKAVLLLMFLVVVALSNMETSQAGVEVTLEEKTTMDDTITETNANEPAERTSNLVVNDAAEKRSHRIQFEQLPGEDEALFPARNLNIAFMGDSVMRFQYVSLCFIYITAGTSPPKMAIPIH